jgi:hypothetical protein
MTEKSLTNNFFSQGFRKWCASIDAGIEEDFYAMLDVYKRCHDKGDAYTKQMEEMGFNFGEEGAGSAWPTYFNYALDHLRQTSKDACVFQPVKIFQSKTGGGSRQSKLHYGLPDIAQSETAYYVANLFTGLGIECFDTDWLEPLNLLRPDVFVLLLADGLFPMGDPTRAGTTQTLAAHDMAHLAGFVAAPHYARAMRGLFNEVGALMARDKQVASALENFDSFYSLRLYYLIEVLTEVRTVPLLESVISFTDDNWGMQPIEHKLFVVDFPPTTAKAQFKRLLTPMSPVERVRYMRNVCDKFHSIVSPLGGESRDVLNRVRKQKRSAFTVGGGNSGLYSAANSKFAQNSIYSLYYDVKEALHELRSSQPNYEIVSTEIYATFLAALTGTAQLTVEDWVAGSLNPVPATNSRLYQYVDGLFDQSHLFWKAFCSPDYAAIAH